MTSETWNVIALGFDGPEPMTVSGLQRMFGVDQETALRIARSTPRAVKHDVPRNVALQYGQALEAIGGRYELQPSSQAFMETSAGEHNSPVVVPMHSAVPMIPSAYAEATAPRRSLHSIVPDRLEAPDQIGSEHVLGDHADSGLEIDVARAGRHVQQGQRDDRHHQSIEVASAGMSSWPPSASQSLPPPRAMYSLPPPRVASTRGPAVRLIAIGVVLIAAGFIGSGSFLVGERAIAVPVLEGVGALLLARGIWALVSK